MTTTEWTNLLRQIDALNPDEQLRLAALLVERARQNYHERAPRRKWADVQGIAHPSLLGEDAQAWVSRIRRESDEQRQTLSSSMQ